MVEGFILDYFYL